MAVRKIKVSDAQQLLKYFRELVVIDPERVET